LIYVYSKWLMRLANININGSPRLCVKGQNGYLDIASVLQNELFSDLRSFLEAGKGALEAAKQLETLRGQKYDRAAFAPVITDPGRILCLGLNYQDHALQSGRPSKPPWPEVFMRNKNTITAPFGELVKPSVTDQFDFEGELGIIIGEGGRFIKAAEAPDKVAGFVVINDATARDWQKAASQWTCGKNFDATFPLGPELVTLDEMDPTNLTLKTSVNGTTFQSANTGEMIFNVWEIVEFLSGICRLAPGDVIATGTPGNVGMALNPPLFLNNGDIVSVEIENLGTITNMVSDGEKPAEPWPWKPKRIDSPLI